MHFWVFMCMYMLYEGVRIHHLPGGQLSASACRFVISAALNTVLGVEGWWMKSVLADAGEALNWRAEKSYWIQTNNQDFNFYPIVCLEILCLQLLWFFCHCLWQTQSCCYQPPLSNQSSLYNILRALSFHFSCNSRIQAKSLFSNPVGCWFIFKYYYKSLLKWSLLCSLSLWWRPAELKYHVHFECSS